jgi:6-phosphogluconolactonase (cycloisomerase 2 family)
MWKKLSVVLAVAAVAAGALVLVACQPPLPAAKTGSLQISLVNSVDPRTLEPPVSMTVTSFTVAGTGPNGATFMESSTGEAVTQDGLALGSWTVVVNATNASGELIGTGTTSAELSDGGPTRVSVTVAPVTGTGALSLVVSWPAGQVQTPSIEATLTPALGTAQALDFTVSGTSAFYSDTSVGNGYYTLAFTLLDDGTAVAGAVDVVRIVTGQTTSGTYTFDKVNGTGGTIRVEIALNLQDPLVVGISGAISPQSVGDSQVLSASVSNYKGDTAYVWYVNGSRQATGSSYTFGPGLGAGHYRIDVTSFAADGTRAGSATQNVRLTAPTLYVANTGSSTLSAFAIGAGGTLIPVSAGTVVPEGGPGDIAISPNGRNLYTLNNEHSLSLFDINSGGTLSLISSFPTGLDNANAFVITPSGTNFYTVEAETGRIALFTIDSGGALSFIDKFTLGPEAWKIVASPDSAYLFSANKKTNSVSVFGIGPGGTPSVIANYPTEGRPSGIAISPDGSTVYVTCYGGGKVAAFHVGAGGTLSSIATYALGLPMGVAVSPNGKYLYATDTASNLVAAFRIGSGGTLSTIGTYATGPIPWQIAISSNNAYLYVTNEGGDGVSAFSIGSDGALTSIGTTATGSGPQGIATGLR